MAMIRGPVLSATVDTSRALRRVAGLEKQVAFAARQAVNDTAKKVQAGLRALMQDRLDQPTRWTLNSTYVRAARPGEVAASVEFKDEFGMAFGKQAGGKDFGKGIPAYKYLEPLVHGGSRRLKRYEVALQRAGLMPPGMMAVGGRYAVDAAGNLRARNTVIPMLSALRAFSEVGYLANRTAASAKRKRGRQGQYFVRKTRWAGKPPGVYERIGGSGMMRRAKPIAIFTKRQTYPQHLPWHATADRVFEAEFPKQFRLALAKALRTARW